MFENALWIWEKEEAKNSYVYFRKKFELRKKPEQICAHIAAESKYWLYVNGKTAVYDGQLKRGPNPDDTYCDEVDLTPYLKKGENTVVALVCYFGEKEDGAQCFSHNGAGKAGFLFELDENVKIFSDQSWKVKRNGAYLDSTLLKNGDERLYPIPNYRLPEYDGYYDAEKEILGVTEKNFDDSAWDCATVLGKAGCAPWNGLFRRPIPLLKDYGLKNFINSSTYRGKITEKDEDFNLYLPYNAQMTPYLDIESNQSGKVIEIFGENLDCGQGRTLMNRLSTKAGRQKVEILNWFNAQRVTFKIPAGIKINELKYRETGYNSEFTGNFICDNAKLNRLWEMSARTLYITMRDNYMDCPDRERAQWWGDVTSEMLITMYALDTKSYLLYEKGVDTLVNWSNSTLFNGKMQTVVPIKNAHFELPLQMLAGIVGFWDYYRYTGRVEILQKTFELSVNYLENWTVDESGGVSHYPGTWDWQDWGEKFDVALLDAAWYYFALKTLMEAAKVLNRPYTHLKEKALKIERGFEKRFYRGKFYADEGIEPDDRANAVALLCGLIPKQRYEQVQKNVFEKVFNSSPYMERYVLEAMCEAGFADKAVDRLKQRYDAMEKFTIDAHKYSTLWELWDRTGGTMNHAWSGAPLIILSSRIAGIKPALPGWEEIAITPEFGELNEIETGFDTVKGRIEMKVYRDNGGMIFQAKTPDTPVCICLPASNRYEENIKVSNARFVGKQNGKFVFKSKGGKIKINY